MRAASLERFKEPLVLRNDVPDPSPAAGEVVVRVRAAGVCRTDLKIVDGAVPTVRTPHIPGHEPAGDVVELGAGVSGFSVGDRVASGPDVPCGICHYCRTGQPNYCDNLCRLGFERNGALAEYLAVPASSLVHLSENVPYDVGATLADAVGSAYHAVVALAKVRPAETVAVYGLGGLGLVAVQVARLSGARVLAVARNEKRRRLAVRLGASEAIDPRDGDLIERIRDATHGLGVQVYLDFVGNDDSTQAAVASCSKGARIVIVGYLAAEVRAPMSGLIYNQFMICGSRGSTRSDLVDAERLIAQGEIQPVIGSTAGLSEVNDDLDALRQGTVIGRAVIRP